MRIKEYLINKYLLIADNCSMIIIVIGFLFFVPTFVAFFYPDEVNNIPLLLIPGIISIISGIIIHFLARRAEQPDSPLDGPDAGVIVVFAWAYASILGAFPFMLTGEYSFIQGLFESVSGWTTTGLSVFNVANASKMLLFFRSWMQFVGGAGFATVMFAMIASPMSPEIFRAEGHSENFVPQIKQASAMILKIYLLYFLLGTIAYHIAGMSIFDAVNHCMAAISTGGFSTKTNSIHSFDSIPIELVSMVLMIIGQTNFSVHYLLFKGQWKKILNNIEVKTTFWILVVTIPLIFFLTTNLLYSNLSSTGELSCFWASYGTSIRAAVFETTSALTTCGFNSSPSFRPWNSFGILILIILMWIGGHTNSTAGGMKQIRLALVLKTIKWYAISLMLPKTAVNTKYVFVEEEGYYIKDRQLVKILCFFGIYTLLFLVGTLVICAYGYPLRDSMFEFASSIGTVGISVGITSQNPPAGVLVIQIIGMFLGRLEFFVVYMAAVKLFLDTRKAATS